MRRREFITLLGGTAAWPLAALAQQAERMRRIGVLMALAETDGQSKARLTAFRQRLNELGWTDGRNVHIDYRWAPGNADQMRLLSKELVELQPDVILGHTTPVVAALLQETHTIPIVFVVVSDPVGSGFVANLPRPGGNVTGFINLEASLVTKWVQLLKEIAPQVTRVSLVFNPDTAPHSRYYINPFEAACRSFGIAPITITVRSAAEIESAITGLRNEPAMGLIVMPDIFIAVHRQLIISLAARYALPAIYPFRYFASEGGLISYGIDNIDLFQRSASYVDRILKGEKPADLPVQVPTKYEMVINLKTAKALGLDVPLSLQARADEMIE